MTVKAWLRFILAVTTILLFPEALLREEQNLRERQRAPELSLYDCRTLEQIATAQPVRLCIADDTHIRRRPLRLRPQDTSFTIDDVGAFRTGVKSPRAR